MLNVAKTNCRHDDRADGGFRTDKSESPADLQQSFCKKVTLPSMRKSILLGLFVTLYGCNESSFRNRVTPHLEEQPLRAGDPGHINNQWIGTDLSALVSELGQPEAAFDTTLQNGVPSTGYIYRSTRGDNCIDTFVIERQTGRVIDYFCR